jgi:CRISPR-associated protein Csd1
MIIQALVRHYENLADDPGSELAPFGYSVQKVAFVIVLEKDGRLFDIQDAREDAPVPAGKAANPKLAKTKKVARRLVVPALPGRTVSVAPGFLCDTPAYVLGFAGEAKASKPERVRECFDAFRDRHLRVKGAVKDAAFAAVCTFLEHWTPLAMRSRPASERALLEEIASGGFGVFKLRSADEYVHERPAVRACWETLHGDASDTGRSKHPSVGDPHAAFIAPTLLDGRTEPLARLHEPAIKGVVGAQTSGAKLASFNCDAFESYGKRQTYNAPIGTRDAFRYCTALNALLADPRHRVRVGETTVVFWTARPGGDRSDAAPGGQSGPALDFLAACIAGMGPQDATLLSRLGGALALARRGQWADLGDPATEFFILGLSPNASRLSVRFWIRSTVGEVFTHLREHMDALDLDGAPERFTPPNLQQVVRETVMAKSGWPDEDRVPPRLVENLARSVLLGLPYPPSLLGAIVQRARADGWVNHAARAESRHVVAHRRACIIAACLRRANPSMEIPMSLDETLADQAYRLGRLFAALDTIAEDASARNVNRRDKYFASASANPSTVFPRLMRLSTFDLKKLGAENAGWRIARERLLQGICDGIDPRNPFPAFLPLAEQGKFCIGYHQQRQALFTRKDSEPAADPAAATV